MGSFINCEIKSEKTGLKVFVITSERRKRTLWVIAHQQREPSIPSVWTPRAYWCNSRVDAHRFPPLGCRTISHPSLLSVCILSYAEVQHVLFLFSVALHLVLPAIFFLSLILLVPNRAGERSRLSHLSIFVSFLSASKFTSSLLENKEPRASFHSNSGCWFNFILKRKSLCKWMYRWINRGGFF